MQFSSLVCLLLTGVLGVLGGFDKSKNNNVVVYWGQNSLGDTTTKGEDQKRLSHYCESGSEVDAFIIAFVIDPVNGPLLNFASAGNNCTHGPPMICKDIGEDIDKCQKDFQKTILLSFGGEAGHIQFKTAQDAKDNAKTMWEMFGPVNSESTTGRPFGKAVIDGFDLDIEQKLDNLGEWATAMREVMGNSHLLTASPQCPEPGSNPMKDVLKPGLLDAVFVQFYNNPQCSPGTNEFSFKPWDMSATENKFKYFMGLPASESAAHNGGYLGVDQLKTNVETAQKDLNFGGIMLWDASQAWNNTNYHQAVASALGKPSASPTA